MNITATLTASLKLLHICRVVVWILCLFFSTSLMTQNDFLPSAKAQAALVGVPQEKVTVPLEPGSSIVGELKGGDSHSYQIKLVADQYLLVLVEQRGINLVVALVGPDNKELLEADTAKSKQGSELLTVIAETSGNYRIEVSPAEKNSATGRYEIKIVELRTPTMEDRALEDARRSSEQSRILRKKGNYDEALPLAEHALAVRETVLGPRHATVADSLHALAVIYDNKGEYAKAEPLNLRALSIREQVLGPDHPDVAKTLNNLAWIYGVRQEYTKAEVLYRRALAIQEKALGVDHPEVATTLNDLALLYYEQGDYDHAVLVNQRVLALREKALGPNDAGVAKALNNIALVYERKGDYANAEAIYQRALPIWETALGPNHPEVAFVLNNLARVYLGQGEYTKAEPLYRRALAISEKALGPDHLNVAMSVSNIAMLYEHKGDYVQAEPLHLRALAIREKRLGSNHPYVAVSLNNLAVLYEGMGDNSKAEPLYRRALVIREKALGPNHPEVGESLNNLGQFYLRRNGRVDSQAETLFQQALVTLEKALGSDHPLVAGPLSNLGELYEGRGDDAKAEQLFKRALAIREKGLSPDHPDVAESLDSLALLYERKKDTHRALAFLSRYSEVRERNLNLNLQLGSERQKVGYLKLFANDTDHALSLHVQLAPGDSGALRLAFTTLLRRKGRGLDAATDNIATLRSHADARDQVLLANLSDARSRLSTVTLRGPGKTSVASYQAQLKQLGEEVDRLEAGIGARSAEFRTLARPVTLEAVQAAIPEGAALVEFALYHSRGKGLDHGKQARYAVYILTGHGQPEWADLGVAAVIDGAVTAWRKALRDPQRSDVRGLARAVDQRVMRPVRSLLGPAEHLLISSDGLLNLIPFAALVDEHNNYLIDRYTITYLTSGRDLLRLQTPRVAKGPAVVLADPAFGEPALVAESAGAGSEKAQNGNGDGKRAKVDHSQIFFGPLPGVGDEVRALKELLPQAIFLTKEKATKAALRNVKGPIILHIATHGFFLEEAQSSGQKSPVTAKVRDETRLGKWAVQVENPLIRSGLALAGANQGNDGNDDGILTALEAAGLDLWGTKLVVLSACDTGVGQVKNGDGVYGLRRALVLAGSESQMMSLWPVSDRSTRDLIVSYYKALLDGQGRSEALRQAQLQMIRNKAHRHPYYWASFIQSGEWANLEGKR